MKKIMILVIAMVMIIFTAGCGNDKTEETKKKKNDGVEEIRVEEIKVEEIRVEEIQVENLYIDGEYVDEKDFNSKINTWDNVKIIAWDND